MAKLLSDREKSRIVTLYRKGLGGQRISKITGRSSRTVYYIVRNAGEKVRTHQTSRGEDHYIAKLTESIVKKIRKIAETKNYKTIELAHQYGVTAPAISNVINRKTWKHV